MSTINPKERPFIPSGPSLVNASELLQKQLQALPANVRSELVLRCDELPFVAADAAKLENVLGGVLSLILSKKEDGAKLYLHINSAQEPGVVPSDPSPNSGVDVLVQFHTNITTAGRWLAADEQQMNHLAKLLHNIGGSLQVNRFKNTGCLFSLTLPGKQ